MTEKKNSLRKQLTKSIGSDSIFTVLESLQFTLDSGTDLISALDAIIEDTEDHNLKDKFGAVLIELQSGVKLWESFRNNQVIPLRSIEIIKIGEENGMLAKNLRIVIDQRKDERELGNKLKSAMIYPAIILCIGLTVAVGTLWFVLPRLTPIYSGLDIQLPITTRFLIYLGDTLSQPGALYLLLVIPLSVALLLTVVKVDRFRRMGEKALLRLPGLGKILKELEISRIGMILGSLLSVGISIDKATKSIIEATPFRIYKDDYQKLHEAIISGSSFKEYFHQNQDIKTKFPATVRQMIDSGERSGNLPYVFSFIGNQYKEKVAQTTQNLTITLEPILLIVMWAFVSVVTISIILPIYSLIGSI